MIRIVENWKLISLICFVVLLAVLFLAGCGARGTAKGHQKISQEEVRRIMKEEDGFLLVDVRTPGEYAEGHIPGAINIPNESIGEEEIPLLPDKNQRILIYCRSGGRSGQTRKKLEKLGYTDILDFGGIMTWKGEIVVP